MTLLSRLARSLLRILPNSWIFWAANRGTALIRRTRSLAFTGERANIEKLDKLLDEAKSLQDFLRDRTLVQRYCSGLESYFGPARFSAKSFREILGQLERLASNVPGFSARAWARPCLNGAFTVTTSGRTRGCDINLLLWRIHRYEWIQRMATKGQARNLGPSQKAQRRKQIEAILFSVTARTWRFEDDLKIQKISRKTARILRNEFYSKLKLDGDLRSAAAFLVWEYFTSSNNKCFYEMDDPDIILDWLDFLRDHSRRVIPPYLKAPIPNAFISLIKHMIPNPRELLRNSDMFPMRYIKPRNHGSLPVSGSNRARIATISVRPFHGIWVGIPAKDCKAGDPAHLDAIDPRRWALSLILGVQTAFIERNGHYQGYARCIPLTDFQGNRYSNLELWASIMTKDVILDTPEAQISKKMRTTLFDHWFPKYVESLPAASRNIVISDSAEIDNCRVKTTVENSPHLNHTLGLSPEELVLTDGLSKIICESSLFERATTEPTRKKMIFDLTMRDANRVFATNPLPIQNRARSVNDQALMEN